MPIRLSGIVSGLDTDSIVQGLSSAYQVKIDNVTKKKKKVEMQMDAWADLNTKIKKLYTGTLSKLKTYGNYKTKKATLSGATNASATVTAGSNAVSGSYKLRIMSTASAAFLTSAKLSAKDADGNPFKNTYDALNATSFKDMIDADGNSLDGLGKISINYDYTAQKMNDSGVPLYSLKDADGNAVDMSYTADDGSTVALGTEATLEDINKYLATLPEDERSEYTQEEVTEHKQGTFDYTFTENSSAADINAALKEAGITGISATMNAGQLSFTNTAGYEDNNGVLTQQGTYTISSTDGTLTKLGFSSENFSVDVTKNDDKYVTSVTADKKFSYQEDATTITGKTKVSDYLGSDGFTFKFNDTAVEITKEDTFDSLCKKIASVSDGKVTASFDATNQRFFINSTETGIANDFSITADDTDPNSAAALAKLGLTESSGAAVQAASDCVVELNGAELTSSTNNIKVDGLGLTIDVQNAAPTETLSITVGEDTDAVYNIVKDFINEYNELVETMSTYYYAEATDYEPLTEDEEAEMSDSQIEKWNKKVQDALLRRDSQLSSVMTTMRSQLASAVTATNSAGETNKYCLASFGICTGTWSEYGKLHIYGDEDDAEYSDKTNKLKEAIANDPDAVMNTIAQIGQNLYNRLGTMMKSTSLNSYQTVYHDKTMKSQVSDYEDEIEELQEKLESMQDKYYSQFSKMESALSKLNSTAGSLGFTQSS